MDNFDYDVKAKAEEITEKEYENIIALRDKKFKSLKELMATEFKESEFLVKGLIPSRSMSVISGYPGVGKTWILLFLAKAVAEGSYFISEDFPAVQTNVGIVEEENGERELKRRFEKMGISDEVPIFLLSQNSIKVDREEDRFFLIEECRKNEIGLLIFDPFISIHRKTENSAEEMQKVMECLQEFINKGITVIFSHHHKKQLGWTRFSPSQMLRGSSVLFGRVDSHLALEIKKEDSTGLYLVVKHEKLREGKKLEPFEIRLYEDESGLMKLEYIGKFEEEELKIEKAKEIILEILSEGEKSRQEIIEILKNEGVGQATTERALRELKENNEIETQQIGRKKIYRLFRHDQDSDGMLFQI